MYVFGSEDQAGGDSLRHPRAPSTWQQNMASPIHTFCASLSNRLRMHVYTRGARGVCNVQPRYLVGRDTRASWFPESLKPCGLLHRCPQSHTKALAESRDSHFIVPPVIPERQTIAIRQHVQIIAAVSLHLRAVHIQTVSERAPNAVPTGQREATPYFPAACVVLAADPKPAGTWARKAWSRVQTTPRLEHMWSPQVGTVTRLLPLASRDPCPFRPSPTPRPPPQAPTVRSRGNSGGDVGVWIAHGGLNCTARTDPKPEIFSKRSGRKDSAKRSHRRKVPSRPLRLGGGGHFGTS